MIPPLGITTQARDLQIDVHDSCNCCCFSWTVPASPTTKVYVNSRGEVRKFDPEKCENEQIALKRTISNLRKIVESMAEDREKDKSEILHIIRDEIVDLREDSPIPITMESVNSILDYFRS